MSSKIGIRIATSFLTADGIDIYFDPNIHTAEYIAEVKKAGLGFHVWTVDDPKKTRLAFERGADTLTTNCAKRKLDTLRSEVSRP